MINMLSSTIENLSLTETPFYDIFEKNEKHSFKICVVGDEGCGKTSVLADYFQNENYLNEFRSYEKWFLPARFTTYKGYHNQKRIELNFYEINCSKKFKQIIPCYLTNSDAVVVFFDLNKELSFFHLDEYFSMIGMFNFLLKLDDYCKSPSVIVLGNKSDLNRMITKSDINTYLTKFIDLWNYFETTTKDRSTVSEAFKKLITDLLEREKVNTVASKIQKFKESAENFAKNYVCLKDTSDSNILENPVDMKKILENSSNTIEDKILNRTITDSFLDELDSEGKERQLFHAITKNSDNAPTCVEKCCIS